MSIRVVIADDHPASLVGMEQAVSALPDVVVAGAVRESSELVDVLCREVVDVVLTDFSMPGGEHGDGIAMLQLLRRRFPQVRLAVVTGIESPQLLRSTLDVGVVALVSKADDFSHIGDAVRSAYDHAVYLSPRVAELVAQDDAPEASGGHGGFSKREGEVVRMLAEGLSIVEIGLRVGRSRKTISAQKLAAMKKLGLKTDADIFRYAIDSGLVRATEASRAVHADQDQP